MIEKQIDIDSLLMPNEAELMIVGVCAGCQEDIIVGEDIYEFDDYGVSILIHQRADCCMGYISEMSFCKIAGK